MLYLGLKQLDRIGNNNPRAGVIQTHLMMTNPENKMTATIPMRNIGPLLIKGPVINDKINVPLATFETPLWPSVNRGARVSTLTDGIHVVLFKDQMARSVLVEANTAARAFEISQTIENSRETLEKVVSQTSRFAKFKNIQIQVVSTLLYIRLEIETGDASGHNMVTKAADALLKWLLETFNDLKYVSVSGNYCTDKKVSAINSIAGRGKKVIAELLVPEKICRRFLKTTPEKIAEINTKKNLIGSIVAGSLCSANAHYANMLLAFYLATGQDAANIVEGSQGITFAEKRENDLYFSVTLPNIIVGTVGNGKDQNFVRQNLEMLGCLDERKPGENAKRLAAIAAAVILCGELSLLAALTNEGELMRAHEKLERA